jgi:hypothetical protein
VSYCFLLPQTGSTVCTLDDARHAENPFRANPLHMQAIPALSAGVRGAGRRQSFNYEAWLNIYAETFGKRYGTVDRLRIAHDARLACIPFSPDDLDEAITQAEYALVADPTHSAYSVATASHA